MFYAAESRFKNESRDAGQRRHYDSPAHEAGDAPISPDRYDTWRFYSVPRKTVRAVRPVTHRSLLNLF
jgi:hypothetical protein